MILHNIISFWFGHIKLYILYTYSCGSGIQGEFAFLNLYRLCPIKTHKKIIFKHIFFFFLNNDVIKTILAEILLYMV